MRIMRERIITGSMVGLFVLLILATGLYAPSEA